MSLSCSDSRPARCARLCCAVLWCPEHICCVWRPACRSERASMESERLHLLELRQAVARDHAIVRGKEDR
jgi:hypothetical protein